MRYLCLYKSGRDSSAPPTEEEMLKMGALIGEMTEAGVLLSTEGCKSSKSGRCVSVKGLQGLTKGQDLVLEGTTAQKQASSVTFSLRGYQSAIRDAAALCDNSGIIHNLVKE
jgi:hypothetical protein